MPQGGGLKDSQLLHAGDARLQLSDLQIERRWTTSGGVWRAAPSILRIGDSLGVHIRLLHISG
jgi:hypothetical protein